MSVNFGEFLFFVVMFKSLLIRQAKPTLPPQR